MHSQPLRKPNEFKNLFRRGSRFFSKHFNFYLLKNNLSNLRLGIVVRKKFGCAVLRNRVRRVIKESLRTGFPKDPTNPIDLMVVVKDKSELEPKSFKVKDFRRTFLGILKRPEAKKFLKVEGRI